MDRSPLLKHLQDQLARRVGVVRMIHTDMAARAVAVRDFRQRPPSLPQLGEGLIGAATADLECSRSIRVQAGYFA